MTIQAARNLVSFPVANTCRCETFLAANQIEAPRG